MNGEREERKKKNQGGKTKPTTASVRRRLFGVVYLARSPSLLPASGNAWLWRSHRARRLHAARPGGRRPLGVQAGLFGRSGIFAVVSRSVSSTASDVPGVASRWSHWSNAGG